MIKETILFEDKSQAIKIAVEFKDENLWLTLNQIAELFDRNKSVISRHLNNIFKEQELDKNSTVAFFATAQKEGKRTVVRDIEYYNLDAIISVGYRVNSKRGTQFRIWANKILKEYILKGYTYNKHKLDNKLINEAKENIDLLAKSLINQDLITDMGQTILELVKDYAISWKILLNYDEETLEKPNFISSNDDFIPYNEAKKAIEILKTELLSKKEATSLFGQERNNELEAIIGNLKQTFGGEELYSSIQEKAAHLLYFVIKDHPFIDGNKRIGSFLFLLYLKYSQGNTSKITDKLIVGLALLIAESDPKQKDLMIKLILNILV